MKNLIKISANLSGVLLVGAVSANTTTNLGGIKSHRRVNKTKIAIFF